MIGRRLIKKMTPNFFALKKFMNIMNKCMHLYNMM